MRRATGVQEEWPSRRQLVLHAVQNPAYRPADTLEEASGGAPAGRLASFGKALVPFTALRQYGAHGQNSYVDVTLTVVANRMAHLPRARGNLA